MKTKIIYEDADLFVIYKPAGIALESQKVTQKDVYSELVSYRKGEYVGLVHRLDQPVEGLLVVAKTKPAAADLSKQLTNGTLKKDYVAIVLLSQVNMGHQETTLVDYLVKDPKTQMARIVSQNTEKAQKAKLTYQIEKKAQDGKEIGCKAKVQVKLKTGRFHQIRVQMAHAGMPLLGDQKYGTQQSKELSEHLNIKTVALCANALSFVHPKTKKEMSFSITPENIAFSCIE